MNIYLIQNFRLHRTNLKNFRAIHSTLFTQYGMTTTMETRLKQNFHIVTVLFVNHFDEILLLCSKF